VDLNCLAIGLTLILSQPFYSVVRVKLFQAFLLSGGANGRLARGDELVEMEFVEGEGVEDFDHDYLEPPTLL
jgi:hypothetical protein